MSLPAVYARCFGRMARSRRLRLIGTVVALVAVMPLAARILAHAQNPPVPMPLPYAYIPSPNFNERPLTSTISSIVLHATVEPTTEGTVAIFLDPVKQVSAHFVVGKDGRVIQMVPLEKRAWHAGPSTLEGLGNLNDYSVGIEMVNLNDGKDPYTDAQYLAVAGIIRFVRTRYYVPDSRIVSHAQIAIPAGRKTDPAGFDFDRIRLLAKTDVVGMPIGQAPPVAAVKPLTDPNAPPPPPKP